MATPFPRTVIPKSSFSDLPLGRYDWEIESAQFDYTRDMLKQIVVQNRALAPSDAEGRVHFERYTIGTQSDKEAEDPNTFTATDNYGAQAFNELLDSLDFDNADIPDLEALLPTLSGMTYSARIKRREGKDKSTGEKTGKFYTNLNSYKKIGVLPAALDQGPVVAARPTTPKVLTKPANGQAGAARTTTPARPMARPAAKPAPRFEIEEAE